VNRLGQTKLRNSRWNRSLLRHLSPEQKNQRKIELQRDWQRRNKKRIPKARKAWLRKFRNKFLLQKRLGKILNKPFFRKTQYQCAVCLYRVGFDSPTISKKLNLTNGSVRAAVFRAGICHVTWREFDAPVQKYGVELTICPIAGQGSSCWSSMACFNFPREATRIQTALDEKESKVSEYRKTCQTVWLLIIADRNFFSAEFSFEPNLLQMKFNSSFDRVFLLDEPQNSIYEFKTDRKQLENIAPVIPFSAAP
jgi:hypothetical protein